jgi:hypothetical protein
VLGAVEEGDFSMSFAQSHRWRFSLFIAGLVLCSVPASAWRAPPAPATGTFNNLTIVDTNGRVGYHMSTGLHVDDFDTPTGRVASCSPSAWGVTTSDTIPPGLALTGNDFEGTPREPGDWYVTVSIAEIGCKQGAAANTNYGPKTVHAHFHIDP